MLDKFYEVPHIGLTVKVLLAVLHSPFFHFFEVGVGVVVFHDFIDLLDKISAIAASVDHFFVPAESRQLKILDPIQFLENPVFELELFPLHSFDKL